MAQSKTQTPAAKEERTIVALRLPVNMAVNLKVLAAKQQTTMTALVEDAIVAYLGRKVK